MFEARHLLLSPRSTPWRAPLPRFADSSKTGISGRPGKLMRQDASARRELNRVVLRPSRCGVLPGRQVTLWISLSCHAQTYVHYAITEPPQTIFPGRGLYVPFVNCSVVRETSFSHPFCSGGASVTATYRTGQQSQITSLVQKWFVTSG